MQNMIWIKGVDNYKPIIKTSKNIHILNQNSSVEEIKSITYEIFVSYFSKLCVPPKDDPVYTELAREMLMLWQRYTKQGLVGPSIYDFSS